MEKGQEFLERLVRHGFTFRVFEAYPQHLGAVKYGCVVLLEVTTEGRWRQFSSAGYLMDGQIGLLIERESHCEFVYKSARVAAEGKVMEDYQKFLKELNDLLAGLDASG